MIAVQPVPRPGSAHLYSTLNERSFFWTWLWRCIYALFVSGGVTSPFKGVGLDIWNVDDSTVRRYEEGIAARSSGGLQWIAHQHGCL